MNDEPKYVRRCFLLADDYISCLHCECNYGSHEWCQVFSFPVDTDETDKNKECASKCANFVPEGMDRAKVKTPEVERWYEKDSLG